MDGSLLVGQVQTGSATDFAQRFRAHHGPLTNALPFSQRQVRREDGVASPFFLPAHEPQPPVDGWTGGTLLD